MGSNEQMRTHVDPVRHANSSRNEQAFDHDQHSTFVRRRAFRLPHRDGCCVHTIAYTTNHTANNQLCEAEGRSLTLLAVSSMCSRRTQDLTHLNDGTHNHPYCSNPDNDSATPQVTKPETGERANQAANLV